ncbi:GLPGLI family protein [Tenacibaculum aiptasiae]|uniref:GLPGLI family protein n=1 Tax=Tenacibaculum aiptasiae TaxID=426481 RepID=UPI003B5B348E
MKKLFIITSLIISIPLQSQNLNIEVTYVKGLKKKTEKKPRVLKDLIYSLIVNNKASLFKHNESMKMDDNMNRRFIALGGGKGIYYKNLKDKIKLRQVETRDGEKFRITYPINQYEWTLSKEKKMIDKYLCYKATAIYTEYNNLKKENVKFYITAWYTPDIPLPFGPAGYDGLPGLILEVKRGGFYFFASKINNANKKYLIASPKKGKLITLENYNKKTYQKWLDIGLDKDYYKKRKKTYKQLKK